MSPACPTAPDQPTGVASAAAANKILAGTHLPAWDAADIGASARLADGRIVWVFGDTLRKDAGVVSNSMLVSSAACVSQLLPVGRGAVIPDPGAHTALWPMSLVTRPSSGGSSVVVICARTRRGSSNDPFDFTFVGTSTALFDVPTGGVPKLEQVQTITPDDPDPDQVNWGAASFRDDQWVYAYGTRLTGEKGVFGHELYVSRVPLRTPADRSTWQFWDGHRWQDDRRAAKAIMPARGGVSQTLSVDETDPGKYVVVSKRDGDLGDFVYTWTATSPAGPFTAHKGVAAPNDLDAGQLEYAPLAHPEVPLGDGRLLVSVSRNTTDFRKLQQDPTLGVPVFVEVTLPK